MSINAHRVEESVWRGQQMKCGGGTLYGAPNGVMVVGVSLEHTSAMRLCTKREKTPRFTL